MNRLEQVFVNLLTNARDAFDDIDRKDKEISVSTHVVNKSVIIEFKDNAGGIDEDKLKKIFQPFFTIKEVGKGTGLGLSISHGIIKEHNGEISCSSQKGKGTIFKIVIGQHQETSGSKVA